MPVFTKNGQVATTVEILQTEKITGLRKEAMIQQEIANIQSARLQIAQNSNNENSQKNKVEIQSLRKNLNEARNASQYYRALLCKPLAEIAAEHSQFKEAYDAQQLIIADWMVSQKAFKELAIQFGAQLGKSKDKVIEEGLSKKIDVLEDKHNPDNNTNVGDSDRIGPYKEKLISKIRNA
jgi:hypothetical protein